MTYTAPFCCQQDIEATILLTRNVSLYWAALSTLPGLFFEMGAPSPLYQPSLIEPYFMPFNQNWTEDYT
jgi:hypothetical protein